MANAAILDRGRFARKERRMRYSWLKRLHLCACVVLCAVHSPALACDDEKYANPDGQDGYGPRYEALELPSEVHDFLDDEGHYTIPSFIDRTIRDQGQECWVTDQDPPSGTLVSCSQTYQCAIDLHVGRS
jgi:hypothetical protein